MSLILSAPARKKMEPRTVSRPSLLDPFLTGDPWLFACSLPGLLVLDVSNYPVAVQPGTLLDQASCNSWIFRIRNSLPRGWGKAG